ncbi:hypothetical protein AXJ14_gp163 [Geobacillus virus E3]|uniref:hypothetical protein n=1 Tax=Geobacillus virus E3 TaxID=1572712 RepID=UPI000671C136|nr:hypothetical protein AXJ14_gp163 [Geobacillus virus E3]AJA41482.1 hypothetical protein E3_0163 [Geobacillus virus E3]
MKRIWTVMKNKQNSAMRCFMEKVKDTNAKEYAEIRKIILKNVKVDDVFGQLIVDPKVVEQLRDYFLNEKN